MKGKNLIFNIKIISTIANQQLEVNKTARLERHKKVFSKVGVLSLPSFKLPSKNFVNKSSIRNLISPHFNIWSKNEVDDNSYSNKLFKRYSLMVAVVFILGSIAPISIGANGAYASDYSSFYIDTSLYANSILINDDGYFTKITPQTNKGDRTNMTDRFTHIVESGETLSIIAEDYGLKTSTLLWENNLSNANSLKVGQKLLIPPVDGVSHKVVSGENIDKIAKKYEVDAETIRTQNNILVADVNIGDEIFIPNGKPLVVEVRTTPARVGTSTRVAIGTPVALDSSNSIPVGEKPFIKPTRGIITNGYYAGHYAIDIADASKPPIWAAGSGTVTKALSGDWYGGYGNHLIIDHGNGLQTLYAHLDYLTVANGDYVEQGEVIGRMGNTGRVYGRTGIHLHFEVILNGVKQLPTNYY